ncbi:MAG: polyhydroxyalkanoate synthesis regulator phasin, partial [Planctomycetota bacterium]
EVARVVAARKAAASGKQPGSTPAAKPAEKPAAKPATKPAAKPAEKPATKPAEKPAEKPAGEPIEVPAQAPSAADEPARRAQQLAKRLVDGGSLSAAEGRIMFNALVNPTSAAGDVEGLGKIRSALNQSLARVGGLVQSGGLSASEARELSAFFNERASSAAQGLAAAEQSAAAKAAEGKLATDKLAAEKAAAQPVTTEPAPAPVEAPVVSDAGADTPARRAQQLVKRLVDGGTLSAAEGREMFTALSDPAAAAGDLKTLGEIRSAVNSARMRLGSLVQASKLDAQQARLLSDVFTARGSEVAQALSASRGSKRPAARAEGDLTARQARELVRRLASEGDLNESEDRGMTLALSDPSGLTGGTEELVMLRKAVNDARPRVTALVQAGKISTEEGRSLTNWFDRRATQAAKAIEASAKSPEEAPERAPAAAPKRAPERAPAAAPEKAPAKAPQAAPAEDPARRAQKLVKGLIDQGRISAQEGRVMFQAMTDPVILGGDQAQLTNLRTALGQVRPRIGQLVSQGHLTAEQGRQLSALFDARATAAAAAIKAPAKEPARENQRPAPGASKTPKVKNAGTRPAKGSGKGPAKDSGKGSGKDSGKDSGKGPAKQDATPKRNAAPKPDAKKGGAPKKRGATPKKKGRDGR